ncbi:MAG: superinfection immunity protein [Alphaproteobacteria bacterium]
MITIKYILAVLLIFAIMMAPAWFASQTKKGKVDNAIIRSASWLLGWTGVGWIFALFWAVKK